MIYDVIYDVLDTPPSNISNIGLGHVAANAYHDGN